MSERFLVIDGYNLMHAAGMARLSYGPGELEKCRERFLGYLARHLTRPQRERTTVVFDAGDAPPGLPRWLTRDAMGILFAERGGDADSEIEELISVHSAPRRIVLVSSDHRLQRAARRRRAAVVKSEAFFSELERLGPVAAESESGSPPPLDPKRTGCTSEAELKGWLEFFGETSETDQADGQLREDDLAYWQARVDELAREERQRP